MSFQLRELTGGAGAIVKAIDLTFANGTGVTFGAEAAKERVRPGGMVTVRDLKVDVGIGAPALSVQIRVLFTDDNGRDSISVAAATITSVYMLSGRITDAAGRAVSGAVVTITFGSASGRTATSNTSGDYLLRTIPVGPVSFTVSAPGFVTTTGTADIHNDTVANVTLARTP